MALRVNSVLWSRTERLVVTIDDTTVADRVLERLDPVLVLSLACSDASGYCDSRRAYRSAGRFDPLTYMCLVGRDAKVIHRQQM